MRFLTLIKTALIESAASLHDPLFYRRSFVAGKGLGIAYLATIICIAWFAVALWQAFLFGPNSALHGPVEYLRTVAPQFPEVVIEKGKASLDKPQPYTINSADGQKLMVIDTSGKAAKAEEQDTVVLITRTALFVRMDEKIDEYAIPAEASGRINSDTLLSLADKWEIMAPFAPFVALPVNALLNFLSFLGRWLILGAVVFLALSPRVIGVTPDRALRIAAHALTASVIMGAAVYGLQLNVFHSPELLQTIIGFLYVLFAAYAIAGKNKPKSGK